MNRLELTVTSLSHDGRAVCRHDKRVVFVRGGLPGQRIAVRIEAEKKRFAEGVCLEVLEQSADCIAPACPHAAECGGCSLQQLTYDTQLFWKRHFVREALHRIAGCKDITEETVRPCLPSPLRWHYRNKIRLACALQDGVFVLGLRAAASHRVIPLRACPLMPAELLPIVTSLQQLLGKNATSVPTDFWRNITLHRPQPVQQAVSATQGTERGTASSTMQTSPPIPTHVTVPSCSTIAPQCLVQCLTRTPDAAGKALVADIGRELMRQHSEITGFVHDVRDEDDTLARAEHTLTRLGECTLHTALGGAFFAYSHDSFFQVNDGAAALLCGEAQRFYAQCRDTEDITRLHAGAGTDAVWDLYCGVGAPGQCIIDADTPLYGVEYTKAAVALAAQNALGNRKKACVYTAGDTRRIIKKLPAPRIVLADPPRAGMHEDVCRALYKSQARDIIYISCNPATLARDIARLRPAYTLQEVVPVDLFPQTPHVESVALLRAVQR